MIVLTVVQSTNTKQQHLPLFYNPHYLQELSLNPASHSHMIIKFPFSVLHYSKDQIIPKDSISNQEELEKLSVDVPLFYKLRWSNIQINIMSQYFSKVVSNIYGIF